MDETYVGGRRRGKRGRGAEGKAIVFGMVERKDRIKAQVVPDVKARTLMPVIEASVSKDAIVYSDDMLSYRKLPQLGYEQRVVAHSEKVYVTGGDIHTNRIEGFWSQLKRSIDGTYHHVTAKHLPEYVDEYSFRYNHRNDEEPMFKTMMAQVVRHSS